MRDKRAFTLIEALAVMVIIGVILGIAVVGVNFFIDRARLTFYKNVEEELILAGSDFYNNNRNEKPIDGINNIDIKNLQEEGYIDKVVDKDGNDSCKGNVYIIADNKNYNYEACIQCEDGQYITNNEFCKNAGDDSKPNCVIMVNNDWLIVGNPAQKATVLCKSQSKLIDKSIVISNFKTSTSAIQLDNLVLSSSDDKQVKYKADIQAVSRGSGKIILLSGSVKNQYNKTNDEVLSDEIRVYNKASEGKIIEGLIYNGKEQVLVTGGEGVNYSQTKGIDAGNYAIIVTAKDGYRFSDGSTTKTVNTKIAKKKPVISISTATGSVNKSSEITFDETSDTIGTFTNTIQNTSIATISSGESNSVKVSEKKTVKIKGNDTGDTTVTISFKPADTNNYEIPSNLTYKVSVKNNSGGYNTCSKSCETVQGYCACINGQCTSCGETSNTASSYCSGYAQSSHKSDCQVTQMKIKKCLFEKFGFSYIDKNGNPKGPTNKSYNSTADAYNACKNTYKYDGCSSYCNKNYSTYTYHAS